MIELSKSELAEQIETLKQKVFQDADNIVKDMLPRKVLLLNDQFTHYYKKRVDDETGIVGGMDSICAIRDNPGKVAPVNLVVNETLQSIKKNIINMLSELSTLKLWIKLKVPPIEDGNTFGGMFFFHIYVL